MQPLFALRSSALPAAFWLASLLLSSLALAQKPTSRLTYRFCHDGHIDGELLRPKDVPSSRPAPPRTVTYNYEILSNNRPAGSMIRKETFHPKGRVSVEITSTFDVRIFFVRRQGSNASRIEYQDGVLRSFETFAQMQGKKVKSWGKREASGLIIHRQEAGQAAKTQTFPFSDFQITTMDFRSRLPSGNSSLEQKQLLIDQQKIVVQTMKALRLAERTLGKQRIPVLLVEAKGPRGTASLVFSTDGILIESVFRSFLGSFLIRLKSIS